MADGSLASGGATVSISTFLILTVLAAGCAEIEGLGRQLARRPGQSPAPSATEAGPGTSGTTPADTSTGSTSQGGGGSSASPTPSPTPLRSAAPSGGQDYRDPEKTVVDASALLLTLTRVSTESATFCGSTRTVVNSTSDWFDLGKMAGFPEPGQGRIRITTTTPEEGYVCDGIKGVPSIGGFLQPSPASITIDYFVWTEDSEDKYPSVAELPWLGLREPTRFAFMKAASPHLILRFIAPGGVVNYGSLTMVVPATDSVFISYRYQVQPGYTNGVF